MSKKDEVREKIANAYAGFNCGGMPCPDVCGYCTHLIEIGDNSYECNRAKEFANKIFEAIPELAVVDRDAELPHCPCEVCKHADDSCPSYCDGWSNWEWRGSYVKEAE